MQAKAPVHPTGRILFVDDDEDFSELFRCSFLDSSVHIDWAPDLIQAEDLLRSVHYDLLVLDDFLATGSGMDLLRNPGDRAPPPLPARIVMLSSQDNPERRGRAASLGVDCWLSKISPRAHIEAEILYQLKRSQSASCPGSSPGQDQVVRAQRVSRRLQTLSKGISPYHFGYETESSLEISGDFFSATSPENHPWRWNVMIADISGKGLGAAMYLGLLGSWFRRAGRKGPFELASLNQEILPHTEGTGDFVTATLVQFDPLGRKLTLENAGHCASFYQPKGEPTEEVARSSNPIGFLQDPSFHREELPFARGDRWVLLTDGILEAGLRTRGGRTTKAWIEVLEAARSLPPEKAARQILAEAQKIESKELGDDRTVVVVEYPEASSEESNT